MFCESTDESSLGCEFAAFESLFSSSEVSDTATAQETPSTDSGTTPSSLKWVDQSSEFYAPKLDILPQTEEKPAPVAEVEGVRSRIKKRKNRSQESGSESLGGNTKRIRNTLAARRYRERQRKDVEVLDARVRQVEHELSQAKLEIMWWKMESSRWKEEVERMRGHSA